MTPEQWTRIKRILLDALARPPEDRSLFLDEVCAGDEELRADLESFLEADDRIGDFMADPIFRLVDS